VACTHNHILCATARHTWSAFGALVLCITLTSPLPRTSLGDLEENTLIQPEAAHGSSSASPVSSKFICAENSFRLEGSFKYVLGSGVPTWGLAHGRYRVQLLGGVSHKVRLIRVGFLEDDKSTGRRSY